MGIVILVIVMVMVAIIGKFAITKARALERRRQSLQLSKRGDGSKEIRKQLIKEVIDTLQSSKHKKECCGKDCGCHSNEIKQEDIPWD